MARKLTVEDLKYLRLLLYGKPGSTKTRTAGTAVFDPRTAPVLWLNAAGNPVSIRQYDPQPDIIDLEKIKDLNDPFNWIKQGQPEDSPFVKKFDLHPPYRSIVVDQITDVQRLSFATVTNSQQLGPGDIPPRTERQHFYGVLGQMVNFSKLYYSLPIHVIMTALEKTERDEMTGAVTYAPLLWGQSDTEVPGYALAVGRLVHRAAESKSLLKVVEDAAGPSLHSVVFWKPSGKYDAKDQYGALGDFMVDPSIPKIMDAIYGEITA